MRLLPITLIFCFFTLFASAQFKGGLKGGMNISNLIVTKSGDLFEGESFSSRISYHIGSYVQQDFNKYLAWQIEVLFSNKGYQHKIEDETINVSLNYLNWPLLLVYKPGRVVELEFGPEIGFLITGEDLLKSFDAGIDIGARFNISKKFLAGLRYSNGFRFKMNYEEATAEGYEPKYQNSCLQFYIGFNLINEQKNEE